jgi:peroxiredoxin
MKGILITILTSAVAIGLFLQGKAVPIKGTTIFSQQSNEYPYMKLFREDGSLFASRDLPAKSILFIYFPDCDHCQREATAFSNHLKAFKNYHLWFISTAPYPDIDRFAKQYKLVGHDNVHFVRTQTQDVLSSFGGIPTPSVYIYSQEKRLVKAFKGETKIEEILKSL